MMKYKLRINKKILIEASSRPNRPENQLSMISRIHKNIQDHPIQFFLSKKERKRE